MGGFRPDVIDRHVVLRAQRGDETAFAVIAREVSGRLMAIAYRILRDPDLAEDAVQRALIEAWRSLPSLRHPDRIEPWLRRLLVRACQLEQRAGRRWQADVRELSIDAAAELAEPTAAAAIHAVDARDEVERAFRRLPTEQRAVVVLHFYLDLPLAAIAEELELPLGTVKSRLHYALAGLRAGVDADRRAALPEGQVP